MEAEAARKTARKTCRIDLSMQNGRECQRRAENGREWKGCVLRIALEASGSFFELISNSLNCLSNIN